MRWSKHCFRRQYIHLNIGSRVVTIEWVLCFSTATPVVLTIAWPSASFHEAPDLFQQMAVENGYEVFSRKERRTGVIGSFSIVHPASTGYSSDRPDQVT